MRKYLIATVAVIIGMVALYHFQAWAIPQPLVDGSMAKKVAYGAGTVFYICVLCIALRKAPEPPADLGEA